MNEQPPGTPTGQPAEETTEDAQQKQPVQPSQRSDYEDPVDESSADSFPASDPPSFTESAATRNPAPER